MGSESKDVVEPSWL